MSPVLATRDNAPTIGFIAAASTTLLATTLLFPARPSPPGALAVPAAVMTAGILFVPLMRIFTGSAQMANAENFVCLGYLFWLLFDLLQGAYDLREASNWALQMALVSIGVSASFMWLGMAGREWKAPEWLASVARSPLETDTIIRLVPVCFLLGMLNFAYSVDFDIPEMFSYLGASRWAAPWARASAGGWGSFIDQMPYFGYVLPSLTALLIARRGVLNGASLFAIVCSIIMLLFLSQGGGRRILGVTVGAALLVWIQVHPGLKLKNILIIVVGALSMAWASQFLLNIRSEGLEMFRARGSVSEVDYFHIDDNFLRLAQVIDIVPRRHPHVGEQQIIYTLVRPIPRVFWPDKPLNPGFDLPSQVGLKGLSLTTSIVGEWYLTYGWLAVAFGGWLHGRLAKAAHALRPAGAANPIIYALSVMVLVAGMRSMVDLVIMSYALVAWWGANRLIARRHHAY